MIDSLFVALQIRIHQALVAPHVKRREIRTQLRRDVVFQRAVQLEKNFLSTGERVVAHVVLLLLKPDSGHGTCLGHDVIRETASIKREAGYMTQRFSLYEDLSVRENLQFLAAVQGLGHREERARVDQVLAEYRLADRVRQLAGTLSGGQKQRLALAGAILHRPELLLLDEPTSAVDPESRREFWDHLFELADHGTTLLVSTHFMDEAERCHRLAILDRGRLVADGSPRELTGSLAYRVLEANSPRPRAAQALLRARADVAGCAQIGNALRLLVPRTTDPALLAAALHEAGIDAALREVPANLEDVFVASTRHRVEAASR